jgi:hypothetical protein
MSNPEEKDPWDLGWDLVLAQENPEDEQDLVAGALAGITSSYDLDDHDSRVDLALFFINSMAHNLTLPQPSDDDPDPLDTPEKEAAAGARMKSLAEHLATAFAQWDSHDRGDQCASCGESLQLDAEPVAKSGKAN